MQHSLTTHQRNFTGLRPVADTVWLRNILDIIFLIWYLHKYRPPDVLGCEKENKPIRTSIYGVL